jgi:hypothetical protein
LNQSDKAGADCSIAVVKTTALGRGEKTQSPGQIDKVTGFGCGAGGNVEKIDIFPLRTARRSFNYVGGNRDGRPTKLRL